MGVRFLLGALLPPLIIFAHLINLFVNWAVYNPVMAPPETGGVGKHLCAALRAVTPACFLACLPWSSGLAQTSGAGTTAAPILQVPMGACAVGMGSAFTAVAGDPFSIHYNPAGFATMMDKEAGLLYLKGLEDQNVEDVTFASPLPFPGLAADGYSTVGAYLLFAQNGTIQVNQTNPDGSFLSSQSLSAGNDFVGALGYAERFADVTTDLFGPMLRMEHFAGLTGKVIHSTLAQQYSATAIAGDFGYLLRFPDTGWTGGASLLNLGSKLKFVNVGDPLPTTFRVGAARVFDLQATTGQKSQVTAALDMDYVAHENDWHANMGAEYAFGDIVAARIGYQFHQDIAGLTAGFGIRLESFQVDYAWAMSDVFSDTHRFSVTYRFGAVSAKERGAVLSPRPAYRAPSPVRPAPEERPAPRPNQPNPGETEQGIPEWIY